MYALVKRKSSTVLEEGEIYWIHPLVRHWAQDAAYDGESMVLETDGHRLRKLHNNGYLQAITLVGCSLVTTDHREVCEWNFEQRNMTHISLCLDSYIPEYDFGADEAAATAKAALALYKFSVLNILRNDVDAAVTSCELSVNLFRRLMPADPPPKLETDMLMAMQQLVSIHVNWLGRTKRELLDEILSRQRRLPAPSDSDLLWTESLLARELKLEGRGDEALAQYKRCLEKVEIALGPGDNLYVTTIHNLARLYEDMHDEVNARKLYDQSAKLCLERLGLNHIGTNIILKSIANFMRRSGDVERELEYLNIVASGSEAIYGLANLITINDLRQLHSWYERQGLSSEADAKAVNEKIIKGEGILADNKRI